MATIVVPHYEPVILARWAFKRLMDYSLERTCLPEDEFVIKQAVALDGLHFDLLDAEQAARIAATLAGAAHDLRGEFRRQSGEDRDQEYAALLADLEMRLDDLRL